MPSVATNMIKEVTAHAQSDSLEDAREICAVDTYFPNNPPVYIYIYIYIYIHTHMYIYIYIIAQSNTTMCYVITIIPLNAKLNPFCPLLALFGALHNLIR